MPDPALNRTDDFYRGDAPSLFWEMTLCQCLASAQSPYQRTLEEPVPYGAIVAAFLAARISGGRGGSVVEVGGGYGSLMAAFAPRWQPATLTQVDLSPRFLSEQRKALAEMLEARYVEADAVEFFADLDEPIDLVISNENIGDFPTVTGLDREAVVRAVTAGGAGGLTGEVAAVVVRYGVDLDRIPERFAFNLGAVRFLEALAGKARAVFLTEHSSDPVLPARYDFLPLPSGDGWPRRVPLKDHDEYTIRFGMLAQVARQLGFTVERFHLAELVGLRSDEGIRFMARTGAVGHETAEIVHEFCEHIAEYQGVVLSGEW